MDFDMANFDIIKAYAISKCGMTRRNNILECIEKISQDVVNHLKQLGLINKKKLFNIEIILTTVEHNNIVQECNICCEDKYIDTFITSNCGHELCKDCFKQTLQNEKREQLFCAYCRSSITQIKLNNESIKKEVSHLMNENT